jgi:hypothetical protein
VRPNRYEIGRANIVFYNWSGATAVAADLSAVLVVGESYVVRDVQNYFGSPVAQGVYDGNAVMLPTISSKVADPVSIPEGPFKPTHTPPEFGMLVVQRICP